jgi:hypothetical protein
MELRIDRLTLRLGGMSAADGRRLVRLVAECLASADPPGAPIAADRLHVSVTPAPGEPLDDTARRIADGLLHALARSS